MRTNINAVKQKCGKVTGEIPQGKAILDMPITTEIGFSCDVARNPAISLKEVEKK